ALLGSSGALANGALAREPAATVIGAIAFTALLAGAAQISMQRAAGTQMPPNVAIDRLVTNRERAFRAQSAADLLGTPSLAQQRLSAIQICTRETLITS